eukprot:TRINITY_DN1638_c0_g1_i2.p1 TRINITY_DN1638_c0_g1~~TRINITY_DN1638_c0_g1_i2.p1  ORF type:complete len:104 (-),score=5.59 TRINITY_DN1638_c0_g1_i2:254-526(-)
MACARRVPKIKGKPPQRRGDGAELGGWGGGTEQLLLLLGLEVLPLGGRDGLLEHKRVDLLHLLRQRLVHKPLPLDQFQPVELVRHNKHLR